MLNLLVCRACLACNVPVYNILHTRYQDLFERITAISVAEDDKPRALCAPCLETLHKCSRLQEKAAVSQGLLTKMLLQNRLNEEAMNSIDRQQHGLVDFLPNFTLEPMRIEIGRTDDVMVKIEPFETQTRDKQDFPEQIVTASKPPNHEISIETVKVKDSPYIQIGAVNVLAGIKTEINDDEDSNNASQVPADESLVDIELEMEQPNCVAVLDYKSSVQEHIHKTYNKDVKEKSEVKSKNESKRHAKKFHIDNRRLKNISCDTCELKCEHKVPKLCEKHTDGIFCCGECDYKSFSRKNLAYHMKRHTKSGMVVCATCGYKCSTKSRLVSHIRIHTKEKPYQCNICKKRFTEVGTLGKHRMHLHKGVKAYKCMWCQYQAATKSHLERHIQRHTGDKRFKCELCDYACVQNWDLKRHLKTHENVKMKQKRVAPIIVEVKSCEEERDREVPVVEGIANETK